MRRYKELFTYDKDLTTVTDKDGKKLTLFKLALPIFFESAMYSLMSTVNAMILSRYSETAAGAISTAAMLLNFIMLLFSMVSSGVTVIITQNLGAGNHKRAGEVATLSVAFCGGMSLLLGTVLSQFAQPLMGLMNLEGQQMAEAVEYFAVVSRFCVVSSLISVLAAITRSYGQTRINFVIALLMNGFNALFCSIVVFRPFETPLYGIAGVGTARVLAEAAALTINLLLVSRLRIGFKWKAVLKPNWQLIGQIFKFGVPSGVGGISYSISAIVTTAIIGSLGAMAVTTKTYCTSIEFYATLLSTALGQATAILIGHNVGRGDMERAYKLCLQSARVSLVCAVGFGALIALFVEPIFKLFFDASPDIIALARGIMLLNLLTEVGKSMNLVMEGSSRAAGDVIFQMTLGLSSCWLVSVLFSLLFVRLGLGLYGVWLAFTLDEGMRALLYLLRWRSRKWMSKRVVQDA